MARKKITIVGAGRVGSTAAFLCYFNGLGDIVLWNRTEKTARGIALDMMEGAPIIDAPVISGPLIRSGASIVGTSDFKKTKNSDVVVITAGQQRSAEMSRDDLLEVNIKIVKKIVKNIVKFNKNCVLVIVTNPLGAMAYTALKISKFNRMKVIGMAGILDSSRFKSFIAKELKVSVQDINAMVLGGHGDTMLPLVSHTNLNGVPLVELMDKKRIDKVVERTRGAGAEIIKLEGSSAYYSAGVSIAEMVEAIVFDKKRILPCSAYLNGEFGLKGIFMGVPVVLGANGIEKIIELKLSKSERKNFIASAQQVKSLVEKIWGKDLLKD